MRQVHTEAIILRRINFGEADRILTVITPTHGKVSLLAKGVRKSKSRLAGGLELFSATNIGYIDGKSELKTTISTRLLAHYGEIVSDIETTMMAYDCMKYVDSATRESCDADFYQVLKNALEALNSHAQNRNVVFVWFCAQLLYLSGSSINTQKQASGESFSEDTGYHFDYETMAFTQHEQGTYQPQHIKFLRLLEKVSKPDNLLKVAHADTLAQELKPLLSHCLKLQ